MSVGAEKLHDIANCIGTTPIVFVGMMGCGKSAIGRMVADALQVEFLDADIEIEKAADMTVAEIFENYGEEEFRRGEQRVVKRLLENGSNVIALGGGAFVNEDTRKLVLEQGISVWIDAELDVLIARVMKRPGKRPLLTKGNPREIISDLLEKRRPAYAEALLKLQSSNVSKAKTRDAVLNLLHDHLCGHRMVVSESQ